MGHQVKYGGLSIYGLQKPDYQIYLIGTREKSAALAPLPKFLTPHWDSVTLDNRCSSSVRATQITCIRNDASINLLPRKTWAALGPFFSLNI